MFDVIEIQIAAPQTVRVLATGKDAANAEAAMNLAIARRGIDKQFYSVVKTGKYRDGDSWLGNGTA